MIRIFLNASTADGYNPYRITRAGIDWEVPDPADPWSNIGYWGDHQIIYLLRLLESQQRTFPGSLSAQLREQVFASSSVPYRIKGFDDLLRDPSDSIVFDRDLHAAQTAAAAELGGDAKLVRDADGNVALVTLAEKLLVPLLAKLSNLVPGGGIWLNTQRPEWNDANNALAGWGLSVVTVAYLRRYTQFLSGLFDRAGSTPLQLSTHVAEFLTAVGEALRTAKPGVACDDAERMRVTAALGRAGERHRARVYRRTPTAPLEVEVDAVRDLLATALAVLDATLAENRRADGMFEGYNILALDGRGGAAVKHLDLMLEGQVAVLSSGVLAAEQTLEVLDALRRSPLYRADQDSYLLYPDREITPFRERNTLAEGASDCVPLFAKLLAAGDSSWWSPIWMATCTSAAS